MNSQEAKLKLQTEYLNARQMHNESLEDYAERFKRIVASYKETLVVAARPSEAYLPDVHA
jgi:hypothetical protein